jgi:hypothetical protein
MGASHDRINLSGGQNSLKNQRPQAERRLGPFQEPSSYPQLLMVADYGIFLFFVSMEKRKFCFKTVYRALCP